MGFHCVHIGYLGAPAGEERSRGGTSFPAGRLSASQGPGSGENPAVNYWGEMEGGFVASGGDINERMEAIAR